MKQFNLKPIASRIISIENIYKSQYYYNDNNSYYYLTTQYIIEHNHNNITVYPALIMATITDSIINIHKRKQNELHKK